MSNAFTITRVDWHPFVAMERATVGSEAAVLTMGEAVLRRADEMVPYEFGMLEASGLVEPDVTPLGAEAIVSYNEPYAAILHEHPEFHFENGRQGKWLEIAVHEGETAYEAVAARELAKAMQAL